MVNFEDKKQFAFTIVELLVVIVIIGILAAIAMVSYSGIQIKAITAVLTSDLDSNSKLIKMYYVEHGVYPDSINSSYCPDAPFADNRYCLKASSGNTLDYSGGGQSFSLIAIHTATSTKYQITEIGQITQITGSGQSPSTSQYDIIAADDSFACAVNASNTIYCWGYNSDGNLGNNSESASSIPVAVDVSGVLAGKTIKSVSVGRFFSCALASDNNVYCWGVNGLGELGNNSTTPSLVPVAVDTSGVLSGKTIKSLSANDDHVCVIASDDKGYCWGYNGDGELGNNSTNDSLTAVAVNMSGVLSGKTLKMISSGGLHTCAIASDDKGYCWGDNTYGQLGNNSIDASLVPVAVEMSGALASKTIKYISSGYKHTCAIASDNLVYCWGINDEGELGDGTILESHVPVLINNSGLLAGKNVNKLSSGRYHTCVVASDDRVYCWGLNNADGVLGNNSTINSSSPVAVDVSGVMSGKIIKEVSAGSNLSCAIDSLNQAYCWGGGSEGGLGNNQNSSSLVPVEVYAPF